MHHSRAGPVTATGPALLGGQMLASRMGPKKPE
ncbi:hypothetical protein JOD52_000657 [Brachybacterium muris]|nr:hypothetical protein [Brachybacterium muris]